MTVQELVTKYSFDVDTKPLEDVEKRVGQLIGFVGKFAAAGAAAAASVFAMAKVTADAGDEALALSQRIGLSVEKLTALQFAAKQSNVDSEMLSGGLRILSKNAFDASTGSAEAMKTFKTLGISIKDAGGNLLSTDQILLQAANRLSQMPDGVKKTALAMDIFGKSGASLIPLLNEGEQGIKRMMDRADELGLTMSTDLAKAGDEFNDSMDELMGALTGIRNVVGGQLIPILTPFIKKITDLVVANRKVIATKLEVFFKNLSLFAKATWEVMSRLFIIFDKIVGVLGGMSRILPIIITLFTAFALGKIVIGIMAIATALQAVGWAGLLMQAKLLAIPLLIGAAVGALVLIFEDLWTFFTDPTAQTFTGDLVNSVKNLWNTFSGMFKDVPLWGKMILDFLLLPIRGVVNAFKNVMEIIDVIRGKTSIGQAASNIFSNLKNVVGGSAASGSLSSAFGFTPSASPANTQTATDNSMQNQMSIVNNINVGQGDALNAGKAVQQGTKDGIEGALRGAQRSFNKKGGY